MGGFTVKNQVFRTSLLFYPCSGLCSVSYLSCLPSLPLYPLFFTYHSIPILSYQSVRKDDLRSLALLFFVFIGLFLPHTSTLSTFPFPISTSPLFAPSALLHPLYSLVLSYYPLVPATQVSSGLVYPPVAGFLGLAFAPLSATGSTPFWQTLATNGQFDSPEMSFWLTRSTSSTDANIPGGAFTLGGTNSSLYTGEIEFINLAVSDPTYWLLTLTGRFPSWHLLMTESLTMDGKV